MKADGTSCSFSSLNNIDIINNDCKFYTTNESSTSIGGEAAEKAIDFTLITPKNAEGTIGDTYYSKGTWDVTINNYTGTVTAVNASTAPTYVFSKKDSTSTLEGVWQDSGENSENASLHLTRKKPTSHYSSALRSFMKHLKNVSP